MDLCRLRARIPIPANATNNRVCDAPGPQPRRNEETEGEKNNRNERYMIHVPRRETRRK